MATATMGLRRRVTVNNSLGLASQTVASTSSKRSRADNNNSPSQGNLNSLNEPPVKKCRGSSSATKSSASAYSSESGSKSRAIGASKSSAKSSSSRDVGIGGVLPATSWPTSSSMADPGPYTAVSALNMGNNQALCAGSLGIPSPIPYMATSMATFVGNATNLGKSSSISYLDISNMTGGSLGTSAGYPANPKTNSAAHDVKNGIALAYPTPSNPQYVSNGSQNMDPAKKFQNDGMFNAYQPWVIKTYGDLAKTKTITIKKYARILRTLRGEEVNSAENSKFRFWVKSKGFHIGQPEGYDAKPADRIIGRHAVTSPGLDPPLYVPTQLPHNKIPAGAEGTVPSKVFKKVAIVENFFDIIHAVHVDLEGRPGKHAGQKRTYRTITETYAFLPREAVTRFLLGCTECQRRPRTPSPTNLSSNQPHTNAAQATPTSSVTVTATPLSPTPGTALSATSGQNTPKLREASHPPESKTLFNYRNPKHQKSSLPPPLEKTEKEREEKYNPLSITNLLKKEPTPPRVFTLAPEAHLPESRKTPESDRASSRSSASNKRKRMLPEGRTPSPPPSAPLPRPWSPGIDTKDTPIDYSLPITTTYLKHQQRLQAEKNKAASKEEHRSPLDYHKSPQVEPEMDNEFSSATGLIDTNLNLLATIHHLHCQVMLALTERLRPSQMMPGPLVLPSTSSFLSSAIIPSELAMIPGQNHS